MINSNSIHTMNANYIYEYLPRTYTAKYEIYWGVCFLSSSEFQSILEKWLRQWTYDYWALLVYWNTSSKARVSLVSRADAIAFLWFLCFLLTPSTEALPLRPPSIRSIADLQPSEPNNYHLLIPGYPHFCQIHVVFGMISPTKLLFLLRHEVMIIHYWYRDF
jgi:hypothetical protein